MGDKEEVERLKWMIRYALDGPDEAIRKILRDALNGVGGAEDIDQASISKGEGR